MGRNRQPIKLVKQWRNTIRSLNWRINCTGKGILIYLEKVGGDLWKILVVRLRVSYNNQVLIIIIYFENVHFCQAKLGLDIRPYEVPPHIPEYRPFRMQTKHFHVILQTFSSSLPIPPPISHPCHLHISTGRHPVIHTLMLQMSKPPQSATPHHIHHTVHPKDCTNPHCAFYPSATLRTSISPSSALSSPEYTDFQPSSPMFQSHMSTHSSINQSINQYFYWSKNFSLDIGSVYLSLYVAWCTKSCQDRW